MTTRCATFPPFFLHLIVLYARQDSFSIIGEVLSLPPRNVYYFQARRDNGVFGCDFISVSYIQYSCNRDTLFKLDIFQILGKKLIYHFFCLKPLLDTCCSALSRGKPIILISTDLASYHNKYCLMLNLLPLQDLNSSICKVSKIYKPSLLEVKMSK